MKITRDSSLIIVDFQNDFCPGGALEVKEADKIIPILNKYIELFEEKDLMIYYTADWHPADHCSFKENGGTWPRHCVQGTKGAEFHPNLKMASYYKIIYKAINPKEDAYSGFEKTELDTSLRKNKIKNLYICGLATDYCVKNTVLDACQLGYNVYLLIDAIKGVNVNPDDSERAIEEMKNAGAIPISLSDLSQ